MQEEKEIPSYILSSLEDLTAQIMDLEEIILAVAQSAPKIPAILPVETPDQIH